MNFRHVNIHDAQGCSTLSGVRAPGLSSSVIMLLNGSLCTKGTNVKKEGLDGNPIETCKTKRENILSKLYKLSSLTLWSLSSQTISKTSVCKLFPK